MKLPKTDKELGGTIEWASSNETLFNPETGLLDFVEFDEKVNVTCKVTCDGETAEKTIEFTVIGWSLYDIAQDFIKQIKGNKIFKDLDLECEYSDYGGSIVTWTTSNTDILDANGKFTQPYDDEPIIVYYTVTTTEPAMTRSFSKEFIAEGLPMSEKVTPILAWLNENVLKDGYITETTEFITYIDDFKATLKWTNPYGKEINVTELLKNPIIGQGTYIDIVITIGNKSTTYSGHFKVRSNAFEDKWQAIEFLVNEIQSDSYKFTKWGYIPFIDNTAADVLVDILPLTYGKQRTGILKTSTEYIVIHDTANTAATANAEMHRRYITNLNNSESSDYISWHYSVDEDHAIQHLPLDEVGYHAGDGSHVFGDVYHNTSFGKTDCIGGGNRNGIGIESCVNSGSDYNDTMRNMAKLVAELLIQYNLGIDRVKQHWHFSGKDCPNVIRTSGRWELFIYLVQMEYYVKTQLSDVTFEWSSIDSNIDNTGHISIKSGTVNYSVKVTYNGETKTYPLSTSFSYK